MPLTELQFREIALNMGIRYVYIGNVPGHKGTHTYCHNCRKTLVERRGHSIECLDIVNGRCMFCNTVIPGRWRGPNTSV